MIAQLIARVAGRRTWSAVALAAALVPVATGAQDRLKTMPGHERYERMRAASATAVRLGVIDAAWSDDGGTFEYSWEGRRYRFDVGKGTTTEIGPAPEPDDRAAGQFGGRGRGAGPARGRQEESAESPNGTWKAFYRDRNLWISAGDGSNAFAVTTDGSEADRIKSGTASWVYGEELGQRTAMWWSPDSTKLAYFRFDEKPVKDYYLPLDQTELQSQLDVEAYPKAGTPNPIVDLFVYDVVTKKSIRVDVRDGKAFDNAVVGHYVYRVSWSPDGRELLFNRTNRRQNVMEFAAADPETGACRVIVREEWPTGWVKNSPTLVYLADGRRFIWESERNGWNNLYLYDLSGRLLAPLTTHTTFEVSGIVRIDEKAGVVFYTARDGDNHLKVQLHRVGLDGTGDDRLTDPAFHHTVGSCLGNAAPRRPGPQGAGGRSCGFSPDNRYFIDIYQTHDIPPASRLVEAATGRIVAELVRSDVTAFEALGLRRAEMFTYTAADGRTPLRGLIQFPSGFDPTKRYPVLVPVYGGPASAGNTARESFVTPSPLTEFGFIVVNLDSRAAPGMGKRTLDAVYLKLGQIEVDDIAAGVRALGSRPYIDLGRVGIFGTSYGGYASLMSILRYPDLFAAASSSSPVTAWNHYDSIYTERYMWIPEDNKDGYKKGSAMSFAGNLRGRLLLYYGTADNNVHPSNSMQIIKALQEAGKSFEVQVGPDREHSGVNQDRMMEFFVEHLMMQSMPLETGR